MSLPEISFSQRQSHNPKTPNPKSCGSQDERVMQLFGLVNSCLGQERECARRDLRITRYAVMPLSPKSGLIEWVPDCDTMHDLIKKYREPRQVPVALEHRMLLTMAHDYDSVPVIQKMEAFEHVINNTRGDDIDQILWRSSLSAEDWLDRRTRFTRSLGTMSMVGYVLGLGDRHPSNVMIQKLTGMIVHIDFGDCFEVAMERSRFPERVPFRLTRMFINAMEVSGVEGIYRTTCEQVMGVLRSYKNSMMAMLQAFVHDPLISQRLLQTKSSSPKKTSPTQHPAPPALPPVPGSAGLMVHQASFAKSTQSSASSSIRRTSLSRRLSTTPDKLNVASPSLACSYIAASKVGAAPPR
jgi:FKBP12-rapamycin complex-associated protein